MQAMTFEKYGDPRNVLKLSMVPMPCTVGPDEVLVKVHAAAFNPIDAARVSGKIKMLRPEATWPAVLGYDVAGIIEQVGSDVSGVAVGDEVAARPSGDMKGGCCA